MLQLVGMTLECISLIPMECMPVPCQGSVSQLIMEESIYGTEAHIHILFLSLMLKSTGSVTLVLVLSMIVRLFIIGS